MSDSEMNIHDPRQKKPLPPFKRKKRIIRSPSPSFSIASIATHVTIAEFDDEGEQVALKERIEGKRKSRSSSPKASSRTNQQQEPSTTPTSSTFVTLSPFGIDSATVAVTPVPVVTKKSPGEKQKKRKRESSDGDGSGGRKDCATATTTTGSEEDDSTGIESTEVAGLVVTKDGDGQEEEEWLVERVMRKKVYAGGEVYYFIKWAKWSSDHNTWEPKENLTNCKNLVDEYEKRLEERRQRAAAKKKNLQQVEKSRRSGQQERILQPSPPLPQLTIERIPNSPVETGKNDATTPPPSLVAEQLEKQQPPRILFSPKMPLLTSEVKGKEKNLREISVSEAFMKGESLEVPPNVESLKVPLNDETLAVPPNDESLKVAPNNETEVPPNNETEVPPNNETEVPPNDETLEVRPLDESEEEEERKIEKRTVSPLFRRFLSENDTPLIIVGHCVCDKVIYLLIRLKPETQEETEQVLKNPLKGLNSTNCVITSNSTRFKKTYHEILIKFYESLIDLKNFKLTNGEKSYELKC